VEGSAPGFDEFMRAGSVREGETNVPLSSAEDEEIQKKHSHATIRVAEVVTPQQPLNHGTCVAEGQVGRLTPHGFETHLQ
jgi:hypothetical protein